MIKTEKIKIQELFECLVVRLVVSVECFWFSGFLEGVLGVGVGFLVNVQLVEVWGFVAVNVVPVVACEFFLAGKE